jgi:uncharacterized membrane protein
MMTTLRDILKDMSDFLVPTGSPGTEVTRSHTWPWAPSVTLLLLALAAGWVIYLYTREHSDARPAFKALLAGLRIALIALVLFMMYGWLLSRHRTDLPDLLLLIDDSQSMTLEDVYEDTGRRQALLQRLDRLGLEGLTRLNLAKLLLLEDDARLLRQLQARYHVKLVQLGGSARALAMTSPPETGESPRGQPEAELASAVAEIEATETSSRLGKGLRDVLESQRGRPTAAALVLTDGVTTEGQALSDVAEYARRRGVPLLLVGLGSDTPPRDLRISDLLVDKVVFAGDLLNFDFRLSGTGYEGRQVDVRLKQTDGKESGPVLAEQSVTVGQDGEPKSLRLSHRPEEEGEFEFVVEVDVLEGEVNLDNNRQTRQVQVRDETLRVLYVQDYPNYDFRFLKNALSRALKRDGREQAVELTTVLQEADLQYTATDATAERVFPVSREELFAYDVLIFGDVNPSFLSRTVLENIVAFVEERGGGLVVLAGPRHTPLSYRDSPLAKLFPVELETAALPPADAVLDEPIRVQPTRLISASPPLQLESTLADSLRVWGELPPLYWMLDAPDLRPGARVLAVASSRTGVSGEPAPVIVLQFVGAGKVVLHTTDESYRWARHPMTERYHAQYWTQMIRYLSRSKLLDGTRAAELTTDRIEYPRGEPVRLRVRFFDDRLAPETDDGVNVMLEHEAGTRRPITLQRDAASRGIFEGSASNLAEGAYRAWVAAPALPGNPPSQRFTIVAPPGEFARLEMDAADMQQAAKTSLGRFYTFETAEELTEHLPRGRQVRIDSLPPTPIWNSPLWALVFLTLITTEWLLRKRAGLL